MNFKRTNYGAVFALALILHLLHGCAPSLYVPSARDVTPEATLAELERGRHLYARRCSSCHNLYHPDRFTDADWRRSIDSMQTRAGIQTDEKSLILKYILAGKHRDSGELTKAPSGKPRD